MSGLAPSRFRDEDFHTNGGGKGEHHPNARYCPLCGTALTWNPGPLCCRCEDSIEEKTDRRTKVPPDLYPQLLLLREQGAKHKYLASLCGVTENYMVSLIGKLRKEQEQWCGS